MTLAKLYSKGVVIADPSTTLGEIGELMARRHVGAVVILDEQKPVGIITDRDLALALATRGLIRHDPVRRVMTSPVTTIHQDEGIFTATRLMRDNVSRRLPLVDDLGRVTGIVSLDDLIILLGRELHNLAEGIDPEVAAANLQRRPLAELIE